MPAWALAFLIVAILGVNLIAAEAGGSSNPPRLRVLVVEDHPVMRYGLRLLIAREADLVVCGEAASAAELAQAVKQGRPDVAIVDLSLRDRGGLGLVREIRARHPDLPVLAMSARDEPFYAESVLRAGAGGYLTRRDGTDKLIEGIRRVARGQVYIADSTASRMIESLAAGGQREASGISALTDRELEVFEMIGQGLRTRQIARKLQVSVKTIGSHREHIKDKLNLADSNELLRQAVQWTLASQQASPECWQVHPRRSETTTRADGAAEPSAKGA